MKTNVKDYSDTFLYSKGNYERGLFDFMMHCEIIDKNTQVMQDIMSDLKRQKSGTYLVKVLNSPNTKICISNKALPRAFKSFVAKDVRGTNKNNKVLWVDLTGVIMKEGNTYSYRSNDIGLIVSYLTAGLNAMIYYKMPDKILNNGSITESGCKCFASLVYYIIDYLRLSGDPAMKSKIIYFSSMYYQINLLCKDPTTSSVLNRSLKLSGLSENAASMVDLVLESVKDPYKNISTFVQGLAAITKSTTLTLDVFIDKWMYHIGVGTQFGLELYPAFANIMIYAYVGSYINHQKTIEKCIGRPMVDFVTDVIAIGSELI